MEAFKSRKFILAVMFTVAGIAGIFTGKLGGGEFIGLAATVLGLYGGANVIAGKVEVKSSDS
jgi:hypothetical protein